MTLLSALDPVEPSPIDHWLAQQADLTAVERFAQRHADESDHRQARYYRDLVPMTTPGPGEQYAFEVDLDACTGCKACVAACHSLNGLDPGESWRSVSLLTGMRAERPIVQTVTAACHHCVDPACLAGCPVDAYEKDPVTGIVVHLDDQCIGCSYCTLTCPYEVPQYNDRRGIVRKCDLCRGRLTEGEAPACVQACPNGAIAVGIVEIAAARASATVGALVPGAPPSAITTPTTTYRSVTERVDVLTPDRARALGPARAHPPLAAMLVLTQLAVGAFVVDLLVRWSSGTSGVVPASDVLLIATVGAVALGASVLHLGRPWRCYRAVVGLGHSWLSREVVAFGAFTGLAMPYAAFLWLGPSADRSALPYLFGGAVASTGLVGIVCSVLIYTTTHRSSWRPAVVGTKFALTATACGLATVVWASDLTRALGDESPGAAAPDARRLLLLLAVCVAVKLAGEAAVFRRAGEHAADRTRRARLLTHDLRTTTIRRFGFGLGTGVALPLLIAATAADLAPWLQLVATTLVLAGVLAGELAERALFFTTASPPR